MNHKRNTSERGQVVIITVIAVVVLLGFVALAVDGGLIYSERRSDQNAADAIAMAGAMAKANGEDFEQAAFTVAEGMGYTPDNPDRSVEVYSPPVEGMYTGDEQYVQVYISSKINTAWVHFVFKGAAQNTSSAVARIRPAVDKVAWMGGNAIIGLQPNGSRVVWAHGTSDEVIQGTIFSNSDHSSQAFLAQGDNKVSVSGGVWAVGGISVQKPANFTGDRYPNSAPLAYPPVNPFADPTCSGTAKLTGTVLSPGNVTKSVAQSLPKTYSFGDPNSNATKIFCFDGDFKINSQDVVSGKNVLLYFPTGSLTINGGATVNLDAPDEGDYKNLLIYQKITSTGRLTINGNSSSTFYGTIYAPGAEIQLNGTGSTTGYHSQIIGLLVDMSGTSMLKLVYDEAENVQAPQPPVIELTE